MVMGAPSHAIGLRFLQAHGTHPHPELALELVWAQLASQGAEHMGATLGWCYVTDELADGLEHIVHGLRTRLPQVAWVGAVGAGVLATGVEYLEEPALAVMLCNLPAGDFRVFHGRQPLPRLSGFMPQAVQVHADGQTPDLQDLLHELAQRTATGQLFGGLSVGDPARWHVATDGGPPPPSPAPEGADHSGLWHGGVSGVAFDARVRLVSRVTQGCTPVGPPRTITGCDRHVVYELDGRPALRCLLNDLGLPGPEQADWHLEALPKVRATLAGLSDADTELMSHGRHFGDDTRMRHLIGLDPQRHGIALADQVETGMRLAFGQRHVAAARQDLVRICAEIREEFDPQEHPGSAPVGAVYISCAGRGGRYFGAPHAEMEILSHALGDIPLVGFFAGGEIARHHLYGYTGVLTVFGA